MAPCHSLNTRLYVSEGMDGEMSVECDVCGQNHITEECPMLGLSTSDFKAQISRSVSLKLCFPATVIRGFVVGVTLVFVDVNTLVSGKNTVTDPLAGGQLQCCAVVL